MTNESLTKKVQKAHTYFERKYKLCIPLAPEAPGSSQHWHTASIVNSYILLFRSTFTHPVILLDLQDTKNDLNTALVLMENEEQKYIKFNENTKSAVLAIYEYYCISKRDFDNNQYEALSYVCRYYLINERHREAESQQSPLLRDMLAKAKY